MHLICIFTNSATAQCHIQKMMIISVYTILCGNYVFFVDNAKKKYPALCSYLFHRNRSQLIEKLLRDSFFKNMFVVNQ